MSSWQRYTDPIAQQRMSKGLCPECGRPGDEHSGWGFGSCLLTDTGVAGRIWQYRQDEQEEERP
jgi:hypothetical protein